MKAECNCNKKECEECFYRSHMMAMEAIDDDGSGVDYDNPNRGNDDEDDSDYNDDDFCPVCGIGLNNSEIRLKFCQNCKSNWSDEEST